MKAHWKRFLDITGAPQGRSQPQSKLHKQIYPQSSCQDDPEWGTGFKTACGTESKKARYRFWSASVCSQAGLAGFNKSLK
jgi:hypothetical protein